MPKTKINQNNLKLQIVNNKHSKHHPASTAPKYLHLINREYVVKDLIKYACYQADRNEAAGETSLQAYTMNRKRHLTLAATRACSTRGGLRIPSFLIRRMPAAAEVMRSAPLPQQVYRTCIPVHSHSHAPPAKRAGLLFRRLPRSPSSPALSPRR